MLSLQESDYIVTFQLKFSKLEQLQPYTTIISQKLAQKSKTYLCYLSNFICDQLKTLDKIAITAKIKFLRTSNKKFFIFCLNDNRV